MDFFSGILSNEILIAASTSWFIAQVVKTIIHLIVTKELRLERMVGSGGMPSCHSATVCALATSAGMVCGVDSPTFAVTVMFAIVTMYDAMGVRRETGRQAEILNEMMILFKEMGKAGNKISAIDKLKEFVGHTPLQVLMGAILGIIVATVESLIFWV